MTVTDVRSPSLPSTLDEVRAHLISCLGADGLRRGRRRLGYKAATVVSGFIGSYLLVMLGRSSPILVALGVAGLMAVFYASIAAVMHDANHGALSSSPRRSRLVGYWLDVFGASSMVWCFKHNGVHHDFANVADTDTDIQQAPFLRLSPHQRRRWWHRFQHLYAPVLYGFITLQSFVADFANLVRGKVKNQRMPARPTTFQVIAFLLGKLVFVTWAIAIPVAVFGPWALLVSAGASWCVGLALALTVQIAHAVDNVEQFADPSAADAGFVEFQAQVTADVTTSGIRGRIVRWMTGGLDLQVVHHFAPSLPHTVYHQLRPHVEALCAAHGVTYRSHPSVRAAIASHFRLLRSLGRPAINLA